MGIPPRSSLTATDTTDANSTVNHLPVLPLFSPAPTPVVKKAGGCLAKFPPAALEQLTQVVYMVNLYGASHGKNASAWEEVVTRLTNDGRFKDSSTNTIRNEMTASLAYFKVSSNLHHII